MGRPPLGPASLEPASRTSSAVVSLRSRVLAPHLLDYVDQVRMSLRTSTVESIERALREFVTFLADFDPEVATVADIRRRHIEGFKLHLSRKPSSKGGTPHRHTIAQHLSCALRTCFERLSEWDGDDVPRGVLVPPGDFPIRDLPLPRFIDDAAAARLITAARAHPYLFTSLCVEFLARTGMRRGEFVADYRQAQSKHADHRPLALFGARP